MPELPEVETVVRDLRPHLVGRGIVSIYAGAKALRKPWRPHWEALLVGSKIGAVGRRGKWIVIDFDSGAGLVVHLGMTGQFTVADAATPRQDHVHLVFTLDPVDLELRFRDIRRFGSADRLSGPGGLAGFF